MKKYSKKLIILVLSVLISTPSFATGNYLGAIEAILFAAVGVMGLISCIGACFVGKGNRFLYFITAPIIGGLFFIFCEYIFEVFSLGDPFPFIWVTLLVPIFYVPTFLLLINISRCKECGFQPGLLNLKNGLCKSCSEE